MGSRPHENVQGLLKSLNNHPQYADLEIITRNTCYDAHRAIVCIRSRYLEANCKLVGENSGKWVIKLEDDDPRAVKKVIDYLYRNDYSYSDARRAARLGWGNGGRVVREDDPYDFHDNVTVVRMEFDESGNIIVADQPPQPPQPPREPDGSSLGLHADVYLLARKYGIKPLRDLALRKFEAVAEVFWDRCAFLLAVKKVYSGHVADQDLGLKRKVVQVILKHLDLLRNRNLLVIMDGTELAKDILLQALDNLDNDV